MRPCYIKLPRINNQSRQTIITTLLEHSRMLGIGLLDGVVRDTHTYFIIGEDSTCWFSPTISSVDHFRDIGFNQFLDEAREELDEGYNKKSEPKYSVGQVLSNGKTTIELVGVDDYRINYRINGYRSIYTDGIGYIETHGYKLIEPKKVLKKRKSKKKKADKKSNDYFVGQMLTNSKHTMELTVVEGESISFLLGGNKVLKNRHIDYISNYGYHPIPVKEKFIEENKAEYQVYFPGKKFRFREDHKQLMELIDAIKEFIIPNVEREEYILSMDELDKYNQQAHEEAELALLPQKELVIKELPTATTNMMWNPDLNFRAKLV